MQGRCGVLPRDAGTRRAALAALLEVIHRLILAFTRHWLAMANGVMALVLGLAFLAPWLMAHGLPWAGQLLYLAYRPLCHQLPERSFFLGGLRAAYSLQELGAHLGYEAPLRWIGDAELGYKMAFCQRDAAIYAGWLVGALAYGLVRGRLRFPNREGRFTNRPYRGVPWWAVVALAAPMAVDGFGQLLGAWESTWWMRIVTGVLFALGTVAFVYPVVDRAMQEAQEIARQSLEELDAPER